MRTKIVILTIMMLVVMSACNTSPGKEQLLKDSLEKARIDKFWIDKHKEDSIAAIGQAHRDSIFKAGQLEELKQYEKTPAGKIHKKHPEWSREDCEKLYKRRVWIGMTLDMLKYSRGNPNSANPSNYGHGTQWQWCWWDYKPSCFYGGDDGIITSYN